jgi:hypothetical protein
MMMIGRYRPITKSMRREPGSIQQARIGCRDASRTIVVMPGRGDVIWYGK